MKNEEFEVKSETAITPQSLFEEIILLLRDYFIGEITLCDKGILYCLPNGQRFIITAQAT